jgi:dihydroneopterin aldolase
LGNFFGDVDYICAFVHEAQVDVHCGLHPWEQHPERPNRLHFTIKLIARLGQGPIPEQDFMDYDRLRNFLRQLQHRDHIPLLETIANEIIEICFSIAGVDACWISIKKHNIFNEMTAAGIEVYRTRAKWSAER